MELRLFSILVTLWQISLVMGKNDLIVTSVKEMDVKNPKIRFDKLEVQKVNKKETVIGGSFNFLEDVSENAILQVDTYQKTKNGYTLSGAGSLNNLHLCTFYKDDKILVPELLEFTDLTEACPFKKGTIKVNKLKVKVERASQNLPVGQYRSDIILLNENNQLGGVSVFYDVYKN